MSSEDAVRKIVFKSRREYNAEPRDIAAYIKLPDELIFRMYRYAIERLGLIAVFDGVALEDRQMFLGCCSTIEIAKIRISEENDINKITTIICE